MNKKIVIIIILMGFLLLGGIIFITNKNVKKPNVKVVQSNSACKNGEFAGKILDSKDESEIKISDPLLEKTISAAFLSAFSGDLVTKNSCNITAIEIRLANIDLNGDGKYEYAVALDYYRASDYNNGEIISLRGNRGLGSFYIFSYISGQWNIVGDLGGAGLSKFDSNTAKGYLKLLIYSPGDASDPADISEYAFDGKEYQKIDSAQYPYMGQSGNPAGKNAAEYQKAVSDEKNTIF